MTVPIQTTFTSSTGNGVTIVFPYTFKVIEEDDLSVYLDGVLQTTGYTVTGLGDDAGGTVVFDTAPANGVVVLRNLDPVLRRETDYQQFGDWNAQTVDNDFDRLWFLSQSFAQKLVRSVKLPADTSDDQVIAESAAARANKLLGFDASGNAAVLAPADLTLVTVSSFMATLLDDASAADARTTLGAYAAAGGTISGNVTLGAGATLTLDSAPTQALHAATKAYVDAAVSGTPTANPSLVQHALNFS